MTRYLFVVPHFVGHVTPLVGVAAELRRRGHDVAWAGDPAVITRLAGEDGTDTVVHPCPRPVDEPDEWPEGIAGLKAFKFMWERVLGPLAEAMEPAVRDAVDRFEPDLMIVDQHTVAGAAVARSAGVPWVTSASTSADLADPLAAVPKVQQWLAEFLRELQTRLGDPAPDSDARFAPELVLAFTTPELCGDVADPRVHFVGPTVSGRAPGDDFPWDRLDPQRELAVVSLGTVTQGPAFLTECVAALRERFPRLQAVIADPSGTIADDGDDVIVRPRVPLVDLFARASVAVCHGGHNTVCEAIHHGVPIVVAPARDSQPAVADQVARSGAGRRVRFFRPTATEIGAALDAVLDDPSYRENVQRVRGSFAVAGGATAAADALEKAL